ncbi:hypothetical protein H5410_024597 [Solanum commersonii]|uniref:DUF4371 domain-containing protein n=1 Tax=Solanum commersonii TaxID=4109 RepID=A0A9J5ZMH2_SOLCO|nr:hypothetical protein H5410_024597 [Solanum commersonii]
MDNMLDFKSLEADPKDRMPISSYGPNIRDLVRRYYIQKSHVNVDHIFPKTKFGDKIVNFDQLGLRRSQWLEYSIKAAAFCLCCYLFKNELESRGNAEIHLQEMVLDLKTKRQSIQSSFDKQSEKARSDYRMRLNASIDVARFLLTSGFPFRGHDESEGSNIRSFDVGRVILGNAPQNDMMICPTIQKDIVEACAKETTKAIIEDLTDVSHKEQMALILRYVNKSGMVIERFLGIVHVNDTSSQSLKKAIYSLLLDHSLCTSKIRGQGYDGASNMQGEINGLKSLILQDTPSVHILFIVLLTNCNWHLDSLRQHQEDKLEELLKFGEVHTGQGLNQERGLQRPRDCPYLLDRFKGENLLSKIHEFEFVFMLHLMFKVLLSTNELNKVLQKKRSRYQVMLRLLDFQRNDQNDAEDERDSMMDEVSLFCGKHGISIPKMNEDYSNGKSGIRVTCSSVMASLSPVDSFANFHKDRIMKLESTTLSEFGEKELELNFQLDDFIVYGQKCDSKFLNLKRNQGSCKSDDRDKTRSNLVTCVSTCEANFDYSLLHSAGKSILINEAYIKNDFM